MIPSGERGLRERSSYKGLCRVVVHFIGTRNLDNVIQRRSVSIMSPSTILIRSRMPERLLRLGLLSRRTSPCNFIPLLKQKLREIGSVLAGHAGDKRVPRWHNYGELGGDIRPRASSLVSSGCANRSF